MDRDVLLHQMTERFQELYNRALDALDRAPDGQWIDAGARVKRSTNASIALSASLIGAVL